MPQHRAGERQFVDYARQTVEVVGAGNGELRPALRRDLLEIVEERYGRANALITNQISVGPLA